jgi:ferredoxin-NADP reductase
VPWQDAVLTAIRRETARATTFTLELTSPRRHLAGQHYVVRLTAPDGYTASRSYSVASAPTDDGTIELTVERLDDGEVSVYLHDVAEVGDELEVRGPIGRYFVWEGTRPALLVGGGAGVVPLMSMVRLARALGRADLLHLVVSVRAPDDLLYAEELATSGATVVYTRRNPRGHDRPPGRLAADDLPVALPAGGLAYVCGTNGFADHATDLLLAAGVETRAIRVERFGPSA